MLIFQIMNVFLVGFCTGKFSNEKGLYNGLYFCKEEILHYTSGLGFVDLDRAGIKSGPMNVYEFINI